MQLSLPLCIIFVAVVSCRANLVGYDDLGVSFNLANYNFQFQTAQYEVNGVHVFNANISSGCHVAVSPELSQQMVFVYWPNASSAGCTYFIDVIQQYASSAVAVPSVLIFTSTSFYVAGLREPYQVQLYLSGNQANFNPPGLSLAIVSRSDGVTLNSLTFPLTANISSNPSLVTVEFYAAPFQSFVWILVTSFIVIAVYGSFEVISVWFRMNKIFFNARIGLYLGITGHALCRIFSEAIDYWSFKGIIPFSMTIFLFWFGFFLIYASFCFLLLTWAEIAIKELGYSSKIWIMKWVLVLTYASIGLLLLLVVIEVLYTVISSVWVALYVIYASLVPILAILCSCAVFFGTRILMTLKSVGSASQSQTIIRTISILLLNAVMTIFIFIVVVLYQSISDFSSSAKSLTSLAQAQATNIVFNITVILWSCFVFYALFFSSFGLHVRSTVDAQTKVVSSTSSKSHDNKNDSEQPSPFLVNFVSENQL